MLAKDYAQIAANAGLVPIPLRGKIPLHKGWQNATLPTALDAFTNFKGHNLGIVTGKNSNVVVLDIDVKGQPDNNSTLTQWKQLVQQHGKIDTFLVQTGGGGFHYYFTYPSAVYNGVQLPTTNKIHKYDIDLRSDGGQIVFPGSIHPDTKKQYAVVRGSVDKIAPMPQWLAKWIYEGTAGIKK